MKYRIAMWASAGFLVAACWALYFAMRSKDNPMEPIVYTLGSLTQPVVLIGSYFHFGMSFYLVILANAATYALVGLIVETSDRGNTAAKTAPRIAQRLSIYEINYTQNPNGGRSWCNGFCTNWQEKWLNR
jgi:hypothetical protein